MIITPNNTPITIGPAWPCCYQYPTTAPNITGNHTNVSFEEIKRRFYNSPKVGNFNLPAIKIFTDGIAGSPWNPHYNFCTVAEGNALIDEMLGYWTNEPFTIYCDRWFHSDSNGVGNNQEFYGYNRKRKDLVRNGSNQIGIFEATWAGTVGSAFQPGNGNQTIGININLGAGDTNFGYVIQVTFNKVIDKTLDTFVLSDFQGNYQEPITFQPQQYVERQIIGQFSIATGPYGSPAVSGWLALEDELEINFTAPTTADWDFDLPSFTVSNSGSMFVGQTTPGQDAAEMDARLNVPSLTYTKTGTGIYKCDPVSTSISNYDGWPAVMYYDCRAQTGSPMPGRPNNPEIGGIYFNSPNLNYYNFGNAFYLKPYPIPLPNLKFNQIWVNDNIYTNGIITHPDAPIVFDNGINVGNWFLEANDGDYLFTGIKLSTPFKYISVPFRFFEHRINKSQAGSASVSGYMPPFQDW